jgi:hypothetical protein
MAVPAYPVQWTSLAGAVSCGGCPRRIEPGRRALKFGKGDREVRRLDGQWFHSYDCLARRAEEEASREEGTDAWRAEPLYELERWARARAREAQARP